MKIQFRKSHLSLSSLRMGSALWVKEVFIHAIKCWSVMAWYNFGNIHFTLCSNVQINDDTWSVFCPWVMWFIMPVTQMSEGFGGLKQLWLITHKVNADLLLGSSSVTFSVPFEKSTFSNLLLYFLSSPKGSHNKSKHSDYQLMTAQKWFFKRFIYTLSFIYQNTAFQWCWRWILFV